MTALRPPVRVLAWVSARLAVRERALVAVLVLAVALCVCLTATLDAVRASAARAEVDSAFALNFGRELSVSRTSDQVDPTALAQAGLAPVTTAPGLATGGGRAVDVMVLRAAPDVTDDFGRTTPGPPGERDGARLTRAVAADLGLSTGDRLTLSLNGVREVVRVAGVVDVPASPDLLAVAVPTTSDQIGADRWIGDATALASPSLAPFLDGARAGVDVVRSQNVGAERSDLLDAGRLAPLKAAVPGGLLLLIGAWAGCCAGVLTRWRRHSAPLAAAGLAPGEVRGVVSAVLVAAGCTGIVVGWAASLGVVAALYSALGRTAGHAWTSWAVAGRRMTWFVVAAVVVVLAVTAWCSEPPRRASRTRTRRSATVAGIVLGLGAVALQAYAWAEPTAPDVVLRYFGSGLLAAAAAPFLVRSVLGRSRRREAGTDPRAVVLDHLRGRVSLLACVLGVLSSAAMFVAGSAEAEVRHSERVYVAPQPVGSVVVDGVPASAAPGLERSWRSVTHGGIVTTVTLLADDHSVFRVTSPSSARCIERYGVQDSMAPDACPVPGATLAPVGTVAVGDVAALTADPDLIQDGAVGVVELSSSGEVLRTWDEPARPDPRLGDRLPSAVVGTDQARASFAQRGATSGRQVLVLESTDQDRADDAARVRAEVQAVAPTAQVFFEQGYDDRGGRMWGYFIAGAGCLVVSLLSVLACTLVAGSLRSDRPALRHCGVSARRLGWWLTWSWLGLLLAVGLLVPYVVLACARWAGPGDSPGWAFGGVAWCCIAAVVGSTVWRGRGA